MIGRFKIFLAALFMVAFAICAFQSGVAEAKADIHYKITGFRIQSGQYVIDGYFYNNGNSGGTPTLMKFLGSVKYNNRSLIVDTSFSGSNLNVGYLAPSDRRSWYFAVTAKNLSAYSGNINWDIKSLVNWK